MTSEYPQDGCSGCCCYDYPADARPQNCTVYCVLLVIGYVISDTCHAVKQEYPQDGRCLKEADGLLFFTKVQVALDSFSTQKNETEEMQCGLI